MAIPSPYHIALPVPAEAMGLPTLGLAADGSPDAATLELGRRYLAHLLDPATLARIPQTTEGAALIALAQLAQHLAAKEGAS